MTLTRSRTSRRVDLRPTPVHTTRLAFQRTWLAYVSGLIVTLRTACERREDAAVFSLAATVAASGAMLLVRRVHRLGQAAHTRRRHTLRPRAVGLATTALLACSLALPVLHALTLSAANGRPHLQRQISHRPRIDAAAPPGPAPPPRLGPSIALQGLPAAHAVHGRRVRRVRAAGAHTRAPRYSVAYGEHRRASRGFFDHEHQARHRQRHRHRHRHQGRRSVLAAGPDRPWRSPPHPSDTHPPGPTSYAACPTTACAAVPDAANRERGAADRYR
jgi:hypothetical protein